MNWESRQINHSLLLVTLVALSLTLLTGCLSLGRPSKRHQKEASARGAQEFVAHRSKLEKATFLVLASEFSSHEAEPHSKGCGMATGISEDGYLVTAAHVPEEKCYVFG